MIFGSKRKIVKIELDNAQYTYFEDNTCFNTLSAKTHSFKVILFGEISNDVGNLVISYGKLNVTTPKNQQNFTGPLNFKVRCNSKIYTSHKHDAALLVGGSPVS